MNDTELRERLRNASSPGSERVPDLEGVVRRARILRARRVTAGLVAGALAVAAILLPLSALSGLRHPGTEPGVSISPAAGYPFGNGRIGFAPRDGWNDLRATDTSVCSSTGAIAEADMGYARQLAAADASGGAIVCLGSAATLTPDGVAFAAWVNGSPYQWSAPDANFPERPPSFRLDPSTLETRWEGKPNDHIARAMLRGTIDWRPVVVWVYFGRLHPSVEQVALAQARLDDLFVNPPASLGGNVAFEPLDGWHTTVGSLASVGGAEAVAVISNVSLPPDPDSFAPPDLSNRQVASLPADGIVIRAEQILSTRDPVPAREYPQRDLPFELRDARIVQGGGEGQPRQDLTTYRMTGLVNGRPIIVQVVFGTADPSQALIRQAQGALDQLVVVPTEPAMNAADGSRLT